MALKTKTDDKRPDAKKPSMYSEVYYFIRRLYFQAKLVGNEVVHIHSSRDIQAIVKKEHNYGIPESTIRRWSITPDKDFEGRTWKQEWQRRLAVGTVNAGKQAPPPEHPFETGNPKTQQPPAETPMQALARLKEQSLKNDLEIAVTGDLLVKFLMKEIHEEYLDKKRINVDKLRVVQSFHVGAKTRLIETTKNLKELEDKVDSLTLYGDMVGVKDAPGRERVRNGFKAILGLAYAKGAEDAVRSQQEIDEIERQQASFDNIKEGSDGNED